MHNICLSLCNNPCQNYHRHDLNDWIPEQYWSLKTLWALARMRLEVHDVAQRHKQVCDWCDTKRHPVVVKGFDPLGHDQELKTNCRKKEIFHIFTAPILGTWTVSLFHSTNPCKCKTIKCNINYWTQDHTMHYNVLRYSFITTSPWWEFL